MRHHRNDWTADDWDKHVKKYYGTGWRSPDTMPAGEVVYVQTIRGLFRWATCKSGAVARGGVSRGDGPRRIDCWRHDKSGDLVAVAWRRKPPRYHTEDIAR